MAAGYPPHRHLCQRRGSPAFANPAGRVYVRRPMDIAPLAIPEVKLVRPKRIGDARGWFAETYRRDRMVADGIVEWFVQDNVSFSARRGTVRGLHFQKPPRAQAKLVRVLSGRIFDVALDLRRSSQTYGKHVGAELDAEEAAAIYVPAGFAHGFCTLTQDVMVSYKVSDIYAPETEAGVLWSDPALGIAWPLGPDEAVLSERDRRWPPLAALEASFA
jgi:dTDP-4-dehydrorhamnose 3,5-epimerase